MLELVFTVSEILGPGAAIVISLILLAIAMEKIEV